MMGSEAVAMEQDVLEIIEFIRKDTRKPHDINRSIQQQIREKIGHKVSDKEIAESTRRFIRYFQILGKINE